MDEKYQQPEAIIDFAGELEKTLDYVLSRERRLVVSGDGTNRKA